MTVAVPVAAPLANASDADNAANDPAAQAALIAFDKAMLGQDFDEKRLAIRALSDPSVGNDDDVLPRLVAAVEDRQASDDAIRALRRRTGLKPSVYYGQSHYPEYPWSDDPQAWQDWLNDRAHARMLQQRVDQLSADAH